MKWHGFSYKYLLVQYCIAGSEDRSANKEIQVHLFNILVTVSGNLKVAQQKDNWELF